MNIIPKVKSKEWCTGKYVHRTVRNSGALKRVFIFHILHQYLFVRCDAVPPLNIQPTINDLPSLENFIKLEK